MIISNNLVKKHKYIFKVRNVNINEIVKTKDLCKQAKLANINNKKQI